MCVTYCRCLLVKGPHQTVTTRLKKHSHTLMFPQHLRVFMGTLSKLALTNTHTHTQMCLHTHAYLGPSKSNETARPKGRQTNPRAAASTCKYRRHMFVNSQQNALVRCDCHINIFKKTNLLSVNTVFNFFKNCLFCCFSVKRIMCKITS